MDEGCQMLSLLAHRGLSHEFVRTASRLPWPMDKDRVVEAERLLVRQVADHPDGDFKNALAGEGLRVVVTVPLTAKGRTLGVIGLGTRAQRSFSQEELTLLAATGQQIGVALENARLYQKAEESAAAAERSRLARDLHDAVSQTLFSASLIAEVLPRLWE
ncbi:MAG: GAF domain-containing protein, partial [Chloroflexota bacterium]